VFVIWMRTAAFIGRVSLAGCTEPAPTSTVNCREGISADAVADATGDGVTEVRAGEARRDGDPPQAQRTTATVTAARSIRL
jgi:hypothetical protein